MAEGMSILNELIIPCMHLMNNFEISKEDLDAIEVMRNRWCSYLGREDMDGREQLPALPLAGCGWAGQCLDPKGKGLREHLKHSLKFLPP